MDADTETMTLVKYFRYYINNGTSFNAAMKKAADYVMEHNPKKKGKNNGRK